MKGSRRGKIFKKMRRKKAKPMPIEIASKLRTESKRVIRIVKKNGRDLTSDLEAQYLLK